MFARNDHHGIILTTERAGLTDPYGAVLGHVNFGFVRSLDLPHHDSRYNAGTTFGALQCASLHSNALISLQTTTDIAGELGFEPCAFLSEKHPFSAPSTTLVQRSPCRNGLGSG